MNSSGLYSSGAVASASTHKGCTLQFFVKKDIVNDVSYICQPYGVPIKGKPSEFLSKGFGASLSQFLFRKVDGQARLLAHPSRFIEAQDILAFFYPANNAYLKQRPAVLKEIKTVLAPLIGSPALVQKTRRYVKALPQ